MDKQEVRTLDKLSKIIMTIGGGISLVAMCCLDSPGMYSYYAGAACILGGFVIGAGYGVRVLSERRREIRIDMIYFRQPDWLDADVELIGIEEVGK